MIYWICIIYKEQGRKSSCPEGRSRLLCGFFFAGPAAYNGKDKRSLIMRPLIGIVPLYDLEKKRFFEKSCGI